MDLLNDDAIIDSSVLVETLKSVLTVAKAGSIPDVKKFKEISELMDDRIRIRRRAIKDIKGVNSKTGLSKAMAVAIMSRYSMPDRSATMTVDKSTYNKDAVRKELMRIEVSQTFKIRELWSSITLTAKEMKDTSHIRDLNRRFTAAIEEVLEHGVILEYINTDSSLAKKVDTAVIKRKEGKTNSILRVVCDAPLETATDLINILRTYNPISDLDTMYQRVNELNTTDVSIDDMESYVKSVLNYSRSTKDYNSVVKWTCSSIIKDVLVTH